MASKVSYSKETTVTDNTGLFIESFDFSLRILAYSITF